MRLLFTLRAGMAALAAALLIAVATVVSVPTPATAVGGTATDWMSRKWGVYLQYLAEDSETVQRPGCAFPCGVPELSAAGWNKRVDSFDVPGLVQQLKSVGAGWLMISVGQTYGYYAAPNPVYDSLVPDTDAHPSRLARRDLIKDLGTALQGTGIKLMVYFGADGPSRDSWATSHLGGLYDQPAFQANYTKIVKQWSQQWGNLVSGWWIDAGWLGYNTYYDGLIDATRAGNPKAVVALNPSEGHYGTVSTKQDYTAGESNPDRWPLHPTSRFLTDNGVQTQVHYLSPAQTWWGNPPNAPMSFDANALVRYTQNVTNVGGAITWDVGFNRANGHMSDAAMSQLRLLGAATGTTPRVPGLLYRCFNPTTRAHLTTTDPNCENLNIDGTLARVLPNQTTGTIPFYRCHNPATGDHLDSTAPNCEGWTQDGLHGFIYTTRVTGSVPLYRCYRPSNHDHLTTTDPNCEGYPNNEGVLGYALPN